MQAPRSLSNPMADRTIRSRKAEPCPVHLTAITAWCAWSPLTSSSAICHDESTFHGSSISPILPNWANVTTLTQQALQYTRCHEHQEEMWYGPACLAQSQFDKLVDNFSHSVGLSSLSLSKPSLKAITRAEQQGDRFDLSPLSSPTDFT